MAKKPEREKTTKWQKVLIGTKWQKSLKDYSGKKVSKHRTSKRFEVRCEGDLTSVLLVLFTCSMLILII